MKNPPKKILVWLSALVLALVMGIVGNHFRNDLELLASRLMGEKIIGGSFSLVDRTGKTVTSKDFRGKFMLVYFGFTFSPEPDQTALSTIGETLEILSGQGSGIVPVFITVDPERDTPNHLKMYAAYFHPRLRTLTGSPQQIEAVAAAFKVTYSRVRKEDMNMDGYVVDHASRMYFLAPDGTFRTHFAQGTTATEMAGRIREFL